MLRKAVNLIGLILIGIILLGIVLISCQKNRSQDLFKEKNDAEIAKVTSAVEVTSAVDDRQKATKKETDIPITKAPKLAIEQGDSTTSVPIGESIEVNGQDISEYFYYEKLTEQVINRIKGKSYKQNCEVPYKELRYVRVLHWGFDDETHRGELIVNKAIAEDIVEIFKELYDQKYPIERMVLVDEYDADDNASMAADNTSSFNYRKVDGTDHLSLHSYGLAIDINPRYNPYVRTIDGEKVVLPDNGKEYADRSEGGSYYISIEDACYKAFIKRGFTWGGAWINSKDYQHFQKKID